MSKTYYQLLYNTANVQKVLPKSMAASFLSEQLEGIGNRSSVIGVSDFKSSAKDSAILHQKVEHYAKEALGNLNQMQNNQQGIRKMFNKHQQKIEDENNEVTNVKPPPSTRSGMRTRSRTGSRQSSANSKRGGSASLVSRTESSCAFGVDLSEYLVSTIVKRKKAEEKVKQNLLLTPSKSALTASRNKFLTASKSSMFSGSVAAMAGLTSQEESMKKEKEARQKKVDGFLKKIEQPFIQMDLGLKGSSAFSEFYQVSLDKLVLEEQQYSNFIKELKSIPENEELSKRFNQRCTKRRTERKYRSELEREFDQIKNTRYIRDFHPFQKEGDKPVVRNEEFM